MKPTEQTWEIEAKEGGIGKMVVKRQERDLEVKWTIWRTGWYIELTPWEAELIAKIMDEAGGGGK